MLDACYCGRTFSYPGALKIHQRSCGKNKKRVNETLAAAKEVWANRKRRRIAGVAGHDDDQADSQRITEAVINHEMELRNMLEASFLSNKLVLD
jgi:hypothetical protein